MHEASDLFSPRRGGKIALTNGGDLEVFFLGVGAAFSQRMRQSNLILVKGATHVVIDLGSRASISLAAAGLSVLDVENLVLTHSHADHVGGVEEWCLEARYVAPLLRGCARGEYKPNLLTTAKYAGILWERTLRGGLEHSKETRPKSAMTLASYVNVVCGEPLRGYGRPVHRLEVGTGDDRIDLKLIRTRHLSADAAAWRDVFYSMGVLVDDRVLVTGDTVFDRELVGEFGAAAEAIFHDCQGFRGGVHASYEELVALPPPIRAKTFLYHLTDGIHEQYDPCADGFAGWARPFEEGRYVFAR